MHNACYGSPWEGFVTKLYLFLEHLKTLPRLFPGGGRLHVLLMDSDTFWATNDVRAIWTRYDCARGDKDLLLATEMSCWLGKHCSPEEVQQLYSDLPPSYSPFINAGAAMGTLEQLIKMLDYIVAHNYNYFISLPNGRTRFDDQFAIVNYFRTRARNEIALDYHQQLFGAFSSIGYRDLPIGYANGRHFVCRNNSGHIVYDCFDFTHLLIRSGFYTLDENTCLLRRNTSGESLLNEEMRTLSPRYSTSSCLFYIVSNSYSPAIWHTSGVFRRKAVGQGLRAYQCCLSKQGV